ncbi:MAG: hypothetical protein CMN28_15865 [Salinisphaeraceae bacterium]|nr:hypothetical protein [Salinisphaeraceae bacterium]
MGLIFLFCGFGGFIIAAYLHLARGRSVELALHGGNEAYVEAIRHGGLPLGTMRVIHHGGLFLYRSICGRSISRWYPDADLGKIDQIDYFLYCLVAAIGLVGFVMVAIASGLSLFMGNAEI